MAREQGMYIPEQVYEAGASARGVDHNRAFMDYEPRGLLGEAGGLLDEFNELDQACHGIIGRKIDVFFDMGFHRAGKPAHE